MPFIAIVYVDDHTAESMLSSGAPLNELADQGKWVGLFRYPARSDLGHTAACKSSSWSRSPIGFMKCAGCGQRNPLVRKFLIRYLFDFLGANHLPNAPKSFRTPEGYGPTESANNN